MRQLQMHLFCLGFILLIIMGPAVMAQSETTQDQVLNANGEKQNQARQQLEMLEQQISQQSDKTADPRQQLQMIQQRLEILHTLAVDARLNQQPQQLVRMQQALRSDAWKLRQSDNPQQRIIGEYWNMLCDLADIRRIARDLESSQRASISRMEGFLEKQAPAADATEPQSLHLIQQVRLALLQLYDQRGQSAQACALISRITRQDPENPALARYLQQTYGYCHLIGQKFNTRLFTVDGKTWDSREKIGKPIVIYFWPGVDLPGDMPRTPDNPMPDDPLWNQLRRFWGEVLLVDMSRSNESGLQIPASPWPSYRQEPGQFSLSAYFHVHSMPRIVLIDKKGIIRAIGGPAISSVLDQLIAEK